MARETNVEIHCVHATIAPYLLCFCRCDGKADFAKELNCDEMYVQIVSVGHNTQLDYVRQSANVAHLRRNSKCLKKDR